MLNIPDYILWKQDNPEPISRTLLSLVSEYRHKPRDDPDCCPRSTTAPLSPLDGQPVYTVTITERLSPYYSEMRRNEVYKARLYTQDTRDSSEHVEVVCKVARKEKYVLRLHVEAELYTTSLLNLQGRVVPRFYGLFEGTMGDDEGSVCVMILQYCGPSLSTPFGCFGIPFRKKIFEVMAEIHKAGVVHGDFRERNFLCDSERHIWVINFALAYPHSDECTSIPTDVTFYGKNESASTIACWEILEIGAELGIWYLGSFYGQRVLPHQVSTLDASTLVSRLPRPFILHSDEDWNTVQKCLFAEAVRFLQDYATWWEERQFLDELASQEENEECSDTVEPAHEDDGHESVYDSTDDDGIEDSGYGSDEIEDEDEEDDDG